MGQSDELCQVYVLIDPRDGTARYVGIRKDPHARLAQHINEVENGKRAWLAELKRMGLSPELEVLETVVEREGDVDAVAIERERYWISSLLRSGAHLANIFGVPRSSSQAAQKRPQHDSKTPFEKARIEAGLTIAQLSIEADLSAPTIIKEWTGAIQYSLLLLPVHASFSVVIWDSPPRIQASVLKRYQAGVKHEHQRHCSALLVEVSIAC